MTETLQQYFHRIYPEHCQRICEIMNKTTHGARWLSRPRSDICPFLDFAFRWNDTTEGWQYWARLSRAENNRLDEDYITSVTEFANR